MLYELFAISRVQVEKEQTKNLIRKAALMVLCEGGVIRKMEQSGEQKLAYKIRKNHEWFQNGRQWSMLFDANPKTIAKLNQEMLLDPFVIRHGIRKH